ncbi:MAG: acetyl-CoA hydrolase/transferase family protein [Deltaproteobacteria bacterium]|nr:acetyl-CoA hydrolase/transferase family protein [Deltaproteobacteria bacterium]
MNWLEIYKQKLTTAEDAVKNIKSGDRVVVGHAAGTPELLLEKMVENKEAYHDVEIVHQVAMGKSLYCLPENRPHFVHNSMFVGATSRQAVREGRSFYTPVNNNDLPYLFIDNILPVDVVLCMLSRPDEHGYCSFGISVDYTKPAAECAKIVIAEVTPHMPRVMGDTFIHVSEIDYIVECDTKPTILNPPTITAIDEAIGGYCAELINDGDCLQLGIGAVPDSVLHFLTHKKDLGIHTEMFSDGVVDLVEQGVVTCSKKNFHPKKMVAGFFMGTEKLYKFINNNIFVEAYPFTYVNSPEIIAKNDNMVSINSALQVDFTGQVASDTIGYLQYSGSGGQLDFVRGAKKSKNGRSILAFSSTAAGGKISRIVSHLDEGASVCTDRMDVHYIITEYGIANLKGKSVIERAKALINIAHPDFRADLKQDLKRLYHNM